MPPLLSNVTFNTSRSIRNSTTGVTGIPEAWLSGVGGHIRPMTASQYATIPQEAMESQFIMTVDWGTDIGEGDVLSSILLLRDGATPWPGNLPSADGNNSPAAAITWRVTYVRPSTPGPLAYTDLFLARVVGSGPTAIQG